MSAARRILAVGALAVVFWAVGDGGRPVRAEAYPIVVLRALDKVTARVSTLQGAIDQPVRFATLEIIARVCEKRPPEETPEAAAFLSIAETGAGGPGTVVFSGWMFASSPGLSALEHPIYDVWVLDCVSSDSSAPVNGASSGPE